MLVSRRSLNLLHKLYRIYQHTIIHSCCLQLPDGPSIIITNTFNINNPNTTFLTDYVQLSGFAQYRRQLPEIYVVLNHGYLTAIIGS